MSCWIKGTWLVIDSFFFIVRQATNKGRNHQPGLSSGYKRFPLPFHFEVEREEREISFGG